MTSTQSLAAAGTALQFTDSASCRRWLEQLTLTNIQLTQQVLTAQLAALREFAVAPLERLRVLEALRDTVEFVQGESARRYAGRALPLETAELTAWRNVQALWREASANYQLCLDACRDGDLPIAPHAALTTMRCLGLAGCAMADHYRAWRQPPAAMWRAAHGLYAHAERHGFARVRVHDGFAQRDPDSSCAEAYARILLVELANPFSLSARQLAFVERWLERWAPLAGITAQPPAAEGLPLTAVDLDGDEGARPAAELAPRPGLRYLDLGELAKALRQSVNLLKQGQTPAQLGLGEDARQPGCENLLMLLYVQWCRAGAARREAGEAAAEPIDVCLGLSSAHSEAGGRDARAAGEISSLEKRQLDTCGFARVTGPATNSGGGAAPELWRGTSGGSTAFLCIQRTSAGGARVSHNQLVGVRRGSGGPFTVGVVQWLRTSDAGWLTCGVRLFPGVPQAVSVRPSNYSPAGGDRYERALLLPETASPGAPSTLVLPAGWFQSGRFVELHTERRQVAELVNLIEKGSDFDRGTILVV
ncbi:MAG: hypothetical protein IT529_02170 [Burkholderiales bacterium]|nr:hypothetical protein [Burkholderiales bacterium]